MSSYQLRCEQHHNRTLVCCEELQSSKVIILSSQENIYTFSAEVTEEMKYMVIQGILEPLQQRGVTNASPVVCQRKKRGELIVCVDLEVPERQGPR